MNATNRPKDLSSLERQGYVRWNRAQMATDYVCEYVCEYVCTLFCHSIFNHEEPKFKSLSLRAFFDRPSQDSMVLSLNIC